MGGIIIEALFAAVVRGCEGCFWVCGVLILLEGGVRGFDVSLVRLVRDGV